MKNRISVKGQLTIRHEKANGEVDEFRIKNLVVAVGKNFLASRAVGTTSPVMSHMALGSGTTAAAANDTTLETELDRVAFDSLSASNNIITHTATFGAGVATGTVAEAGMFNSASAGDMIARTVFAPLVKASGDVLTIQWQIIIG